MPKIRYDNIDNVSIDKTLKQFKQWREDRRRKASRDRSYVVPHAEPEMDYLHANREDASITWIGHSTFFLQYEGLNIVTDPVWAQRLAFQRRIGQPGIPIEDVPPIDIILISHSHYDHMHINSIRKLYRSSTTIIVPAGLKSKMVRKGFHRCHEMHWWETFKVGDVNITFVPTQHWSRRTLLDTNTSHWGGYVLEPVQHPVLPDEPHNVWNTEQDPTAPKPSVPAVSGDSHADGYIHEPLPPTIYFAGDSGYFPGFSEIGRRHKIHVALMPIGAYEPEWFLSSQHTTPEEALRAFCDVGAETMIPMHYGTFKLADDTAKEALDRLEAERERLKIEPERIRVLGYGETLIVHGNADEEADSEDKENVI
ncbi:MBL fold metallo-hydrolase [Paenibacillus dauci]|uniref:MBL fold metallo-hydrolase n=1 Tax=Paenibacillus dauci TaxID=1567106 RepID=UPI00061937CD|nr:MBL fold metallo-hydrolase [Paenibacillus dauci]